MSSLLPTEQYVHWVAVAGSLSWPTMVVEAAVFRCWRRRRHRHRWYSAIVMAFSIEDFQNLIRLLDQRPEWRAELRRQLLTDDLLELPSIVRQLAGAQSRSEARLERVEARLEGVEARLEGVEARLEGVEVRLERLEAVVGQLLDAQVRTERWMAELAEAQARAERRLGRVEQEVGDLKGMNLEARVRSRPAAYLGRLLDDPVTLADEDLYGLLNQAVANARLDRGSRDDILRADAIVRGRLPNTEEEAHLVVEVSWRIGVDDVLRAERRARLLAQTGVSTRPVVAGESIADDAEEAALSAGVERVVGD